MKSFLKPLLFVSLFVLLNFSYATVKYVPWPYLQIQRAIDDAQNGDTVSVWGFDEPPFIYYENINFVGKDIHVVNRSYITNTGYPPSPDWVVIDGQQKGSVVTFNHSETRDAILKGFTIRI